MKNTNKTKLVARLMLVVVLVVSTLTLFSCGGPNIFGYYRAERNCEYSSHQEFKSFVEKYNSKNDGTVSTFVSFDFDSIDIVSDRSYYWGIVANLNEYVDDTIFDKYQDYLSIRMKFYVDELKENGELMKKAYQIFCLYSTKTLDYIFDKNDNITLNLIDDLGGASLPGIYDKYNPYDENYNYIDTYVLNVNGTEFMKIYISALDTNISREKLNEICQLLMDNIVIINTEV